MNHSDYAAIAITVTLLVAALVFAPINLVYGLLAFYIGISFGLNYLAWKNRFWKKRDENWTNSWVEGLVCGLIVWILVALIALWLNLPLLFMYGFGFSGVLAGVIGFYVITYPAFIFPVLFRVSQKGETISERVRIVSFIHYAVVLALLGGYGFYLFLVSLGFSPAVAFSIGPPFIGILAIGFLYLVFRLEKWWKLQRWKKDEGA